jgi:hypothetical protein
VLGLVYKATGLYCTDIKSTLLGCTAIGIVYTDLGSIVPVWRAIGMVCTVNIISFCEKH